MKTEAADVCPLTLNSTCSKIAFTKGFRGLYDHVEIKEKQIY